MRVDGIGTQPVQAAAGSPTGAAAFEQVLVQQLAQFLVPTDDDGEQPQLLAQLLPDAFAQSIEAAGGLGLRLGGGS